MSIETWLIASLATWRISRMIAIEEGPFSVFAWLRGWADPHQATWIGRGLQCVMCISFWIALIIAVVLQVGIIEWLAIAGGAAALHRLMG